MGASKQQNRGHVSPDCELRQKRPVQTSTTFPFMILSSVFRFASNEHFELGSQTLCTGAFKYQQQAAAKKKPVSSFTLTFIFAVSVEDRTVPPWTDGEQLSIQTTLGVRYLTRIKGARTPPYGTNPQEEPQPASFEVPRDIFSLTVANAAQAGDEFNIRLVTVNVEQINLYPSSEASLVLRIQFGSRKQFQQIHYGHMKNKRGLKIQWPDR